MTGASAFQIPGLTGFVEIDTRTRFGLSTLPASPHPGRRAPRLTHGLTAAKLNPGLAEANAPADLQLIARAPLTAPPQSPLPAEGPLLQPSLALNIDTAQVRPTHQHHTVHASVTPTTPSTRLHFTKAKAPTPSSHQGSEPTPLPHTAQPNSCLHLLQSQTSLPI